MAKVYNVNMEPVHGGSSFFYTLKETLKTAGWVVSQSSDGTTFYSASDGITTAASGTNGMNNTNAWYWILDPDLKKGMVAQRGSQERDWRLWIAANWQNDTTVSGSATVTTRPTTTTFHTNNAGYALIIGTYTGGFETFFDVSSSYRYHIIAMDTPYNGTYPFYCFCSAYPTVVGKTNSMIYWDPFLSGAHNPADEAPWSFRAIYAGGSSYGTYGLNIQDAAVYSITHGYGSKTVGGSSAVSGSGLVIQNYNKGSGRFFHSASGLVHHALASAAANTVSNLVIANGFTDTIDSRDYLAPYLIYSNTNGRFFSISAYIKTNQNGRYNGNNRKYPDTVNLTTNAYVTVGGGGFSVPWPENVVPIN